MPDHSARASTAVRECAPRAIVEFRRTPNGAAVMSVVTADLDRNTVGIFRTAFRALLEDALPEGAATGAGTARAETAIGWSSSIFREWTS